MIPAFICFIQARRGHRGRRTPLVDGILTACIMSARSKRFGNNGKTLCQPFIDGIRVTGVVDRYFK